MRDQSLDVRLAALERSMRIQRRVIAALLACCCVIAVMPAFRAQQGADVLRAKGLIIEDDTGRARIVVGRMDPPPSIRGYGLRINDPAGEERLGMSLDDRGRIGIGLDAPPGKGDDRNRERINLVADENGGAYMAWKDRRTGVVARMYLDDEQKVWMQFSDFTQKPAVIRRYGLSGEEAVRPK